MTVMNSNVCKLIFSLWLKAAQLDLPFFSRAHHNFLETYRNTTCSRFARTFCNFLSPAASSCGEWDLPGKSGKQKRK